MQASDGIGQQLHLQMILASGKTPKQLRTMQYEEHCPPPRIPHPFDPLIESGSMLRFWKSTDAEIAQRHKLMATSKTLCQPSDFPKKEKKTEISFFHQAPAWSWNSKDGFEKFMTAVDDNDIQTITTALQHKIDINSPAFDTGANLAMHAVSYGNHKIIELLLRNDIDLSYKDDANHTMLHYAAQYNNDPMTLSLLLIQRKLIHYIEPFKSIDFAPSNRRARLDTQDTPPYKRYLELEAQDNDGDTPLSCAIVGEKFQNVRLLLTTGANVLHTNKKQQSLTELPSTPAITAYIAAEIQKEKEANRHV